MKKTKKTASNLQEHNAILLGALHNSEVFILYQNCDFIYQWAENLPLFLKNKWQESCVDADIFPYNFCKSLAILQEKIKKTGKKQSLKICLFDEKKKPYWYQWILECHYNAKGKHSGYITTACNISSLQQCHDKHMHLQLEVNHRSKNLFAIIQSIANQTGQHSSTISIFLNKFRGRIQSLANALDLVTERDKYGTALDRTIKAQIAQYYPTELMPVKIVGENPNMVPDAVIYIGLALQELLMNSLAYGVLNHAKHHKCEKTAITIDAIYEKTAKNTKILTLSWTEKFDKSMTITPDLQAHFGRAILEKIVPTSLNGQAFLQMNAHGVIYRLSLNSTYFST